MKTNPTPTRIPFIRSRSMVATAFLLGLIAIFVQGIAMSAPERLSMGDSRRGLQPNERGEGFNHATAVAGNMKVVQLYASSTNLSDGINYAFLEEHEMLVHSVFIDNGLTDDDEANRGYVS